MDQWLFCYGTLRAPRLLSALLGRAMAAIPASLDDHVCARLRGRPYPGLWAAPGSRAAGACYRLHHRRELARLDRYEGSEYRRRRVRVATADGPRQAWVYVPRRGRAGRGGPWSVLDFERRALGRSRRQALAWRAADVAAGGGRDA